MAVAVDNAVASISPMALSLLGRMMCLSLVYLFTCGITKCAVKLLCHSWAVIKCLDVGTIAGCEGVYTSTGELVDILPFLTSCITKMGFQLCAVFCICVSFESISALPPAEK